MYKKSVSCLCLILIALLVSPATHLARPSGSGLNGIDTFIEQVMRDWKVPGMAVAVVKDGRIAYAKGFGHRDVKRSLAVTPDTLFAIGSCSKAFTAAALAILVDEGKLEWDRPVRDYMPDFRLKDEYATQHLTPRVLVTHQSGMPRHDLVWYGAPLSRKDIYERLRHLESSKPLHAKFQYNNLMYMTAGVLIERISGMSWESFVKFKILDPLEMKTSNFSVNDSQKTSDFALPYRETKDVVKEIPFRNIDAIGPAGSINSSANEMANWLVMQLNKGKFKDRQVISEAGLRETHAPQIVSGTAPQFDELFYSSYAMGWGVSAYRGRPVLSHSGGIDGFISQVRLLPKEALGIVILTNSETNAGGIVAYNIMDRMLGLNEIDWNRRLKDERAKATESQQKSRAAGEAARKQGTQPSHPLKDFAGQFEHPAYGTLWITAQGDQLKMDLHGLKAALKHYHYDVFEVVPESESFSGEALAGLKLAFTTDKKGEVESVTLPLEPSVRDIVFTRRAEPRLSSALERFAGEYELSTMSISVSLRGAGVLIASVPGQPDYELVARKETLFAVKGVEGYAIEFTVDTSGKVTGALLTQPDGSFSLKKK